MSNDNEFNELAHENAGLALRVAFVLVFNVLALLSLTVFGDRPKRVKPDEHWAFEFGQWASAVAWVVLAVILGAVNAFGGVVCGLLSGFLLARRIAATGHHAYSTKVRDLAPYLAGPNGRRLGRIVTAAAAIGVFAALLPIGGLAQAIGVLVTTAIVGAFAVASRARKRVLVGETLMLEYAVGQVISPAFGVKPDDLYEHAIINFPGDSRIDMTTVPSLVALRFVNDRTKVEQNLAAVDGGDWEIAPESTSTNICLIPTTPETRERRAALAASGGLLGADIEVAEPLAIRAPARGEWVMTAEDLA